ncbi:MAG: fimbrillin family protein [Prevotella sp.]|nr:fimbrillin family protein [Prevotella sp.]
MTNNNNILLTLAALLAACSSDTALEDAQHVDLRQPMRFGLSTADTPAEQAVTRAALENTYQDFKVSAWKYFGDDGQQQNVMDGYKVEYSATPFNDYGDGYNWHYENINEQLLRYWDLAAFPYEFRAVSPYNTTAAITTDGLNVAADFKSHVLYNDAYYHTYTSEEVNTPCTKADGEPCVVANVSRAKRINDDGNQYVDTDKIKDTPINEAGKANATREVHLPFHHLMSKVGFKIFIDNPQPFDMQFDDGKGDEYGVWIDNIRITAKADDPGFVTAANGYTATGQQGLLEGQFTGTTTQSGEYTLLFHNAYNSIADQNLHYHLSRETAYSLTKKNGALDDLHQLPQQNVRLHVVMDIHTNHVEPDDQQFHYDSWLSLDKNNTEGDRFTWLPDHKYIYVLRIPNLHGHEINLHTCEVLPWDDVQTTDIDVVL